MIMVLPKKFCSRSSGWQKQIDLLVQRRKSELTDIKPGALYSTDPKVIFVTMIRRPLQFPVGSQMSKTISLRAKFNNALNDIAYEREYSILSIDACDTENHFDLMGNLNHYGEVTFWKQMNHLLSLFDKKKVELTPIRCRSTSAHRNASGDRAFYN